MVMKHPQTSQARPRKNRWRPQTIASPKTFGLNAGDAFNSQLVRFELGATAGQAFEACEKVTSFVLRVL